MYLSAGSEEAKAISEYLLELFSACLNAEYITFANSASCTYTVNDKNLRLFFEHSNGIEDWINNFDFKAVPYSGMSDVWYCHGGFLRVFKSVTPFIKKVIGELHDQIENITVVGYSHGAALAVLCHEFIVFNYPKFQHMTFSYGFGCPRVIAEGVPNEVAQRWETFHVIRNLDDLVTHLPPEILGYTHVGYTIEIGKKGKYSCENCPDIDAHRPENYIAELEMLKDGNGTSGLRMYKNV